MIPYPKLHTTGQAYLRYKGKSFYFGKYGSPDAEAKYQKWKQSLEGNGQPERYGTIVELFKAYRLHNPKAQDDKLKAVEDFGPLAGLRTNQFSPLAFRKLRERVASTNTRCARHVNDLMRLVQRVFRWGVSMELVPLDVYTKLKTVDPLKPHEVIKQSKKRQPAKREDVFKTLTELAPMPRAIVQLILFTGARPGEICAMRASEVRKDGPHGTWVYRPSKHKTEHHGKRKYIPFGPQGQSILNEWWPKIGDLFFPAVLTTGSYRPASLKQAVEHAAQRAGVPHWTPYQLRHLRMTELSVDKGLEVAASVAGHGELGTTRGYTHEPDADSLKKAI